MYAGLANDHKYCKSDLTPQKTITNKNKIAFKKCVWCIWFYKMPFDKPQIEWEATINLFANTMCTPFAHQ